MDLVNLLFLAGACQESMSYLRGKTYEEAWALSGDEWRNWARSCGSGEGCGAGYLHGCGHGFGSGYGYGFGSGYGYGSGFGDGFGSGHGSDYGDGDGRGDDLEIWHDGAWRGRAWARSEIARLAGEMVKHGRS